MLLLANAAEPLAAPLAPPTDAKPKLPVESPSTPALLRFARGACAGVVAAAAAAVPGVVVAGGVSRLGREKHVSVARRGMLPRDGSGCNGGLPGATPPAPPPPPLPAVLPPPAMAARKR